MRNNLIATTIFGLLTLAIPILSADQDLVIVSIGDSVAAGEGNPDSFNGSSAGWVSASCHRSVNNGRHFASNRINNLPNVTTQFADFACSGASITDGLLGPQQTDEPNVNNFVVPPQIQQVADFQRSPNGLNGRAIDILMVSIGGNDVGFAPVVENCLNPTASDCTTSAVVTNALNDIANKLPRLYDNVVLAIQANLNVKHVYFTEYPDEMSSRPGDTCGHADNGFGDASMIGASANETTFLRQNFLLPLNGQIQMAVGRAVARFPNIAWRFVEGPQTMFATHGFCTPLARRYVNTVADSLERQGDDRGSMHPNTAGHQAYADALIAQATVDFNLSMEPPRIVRRQEDNVGIPRPILFLPDPNEPLAKKEVDVEVGQHVGTLSAILQSRIRTPFLPAPAFANTAMADTAAGSLTVFSGVIPGSDTLLPGQWIEYNVVVSASFNGHTTSHATGTQTIGLVLAQ